MPPPSQPPTSAQCFVQHAVEAQCEAQVQVTPADLNITQDKSNTGFSGRPQPEGATGSTQIAQQQATGSATQDTQTADVAVNISPGVSHVNVPKEIQTETPKEITSSDDLEIAVKEEYWTSAKRAR